MRVQDIMSEPVRTVSPTTSADKALTVMRVSRIHHLPVMRDQRVLGVISRSDVGGRAETAVRLNHTVADVMSEQVMTIEPTDTIRAAANRMRAAASDCLVVMRGGRMVGILTVTDLLELLGRGVARPETVTRRWTLKHRAPHRKRHRAAGVW